MAVPAQYQKYIIRLLRLEGERGYERPDDYVFRGKSGKPLAYKTVYNNFRRILGEGHGTHWMRKTFAQLLFKHLLAQNRDDPMRALELTRRALDHARIDTTIKYLSIVEDNIKQSQDAIFNTKETKNEAR